MGNFDTAFKKLFGSIEVTEEKSNYHYLVDLYRNSMIKAKLAEILKNSPDEKFAAMAENTAANARELEAEAFTKGVSAAKNLTTGTAETSGEAKFLADVKKLYPDIDNYAAYKDRVANLAPSLFKASAPAATEAEVVAIEKRALHTAAASSVEHTALTAAAKKILSIVAHVGPLGNAVAVAEIAKTLIDNHLIHPDAAQSMAAHSNPELAAKSQADIVATQIMNQLINQHAPIH